MAHALALCCLLLGAASDGPPLPLPDRPPGLPCPAECERLSWAVWWHHDDWENAASLLEGPDRDRVLAVAHFWAEASWAWWHAGHLQDPGRGIDVRDEDRRLLASKVGVRDYLAGRIPLPD